MSEHRQHPLMVGIVGDSAAGKSTYAAGIAAIFGLSRAVTICTDDYHRFSRQERSKRGLTPHDPACNHMDILEQHVLLLRRGEPILKPVYNHHGGVLEAPEYVPPKPIIIVEGLLGLATPALRDCYDVKIFLEPQEQLRLRWKYQRDTGPGGYGVEQVMASLDRLGRDSQRFVLPQREYADVIVSFRPPEADPEETGGKLDVRHILRPTLPELDLAPVLRAGKDAALRLELARDIDGRPVDCLLIPGSVDAAEADRVASCLRTASTVAGSPAPAAIGAYRNADDRVHHSHPLALSQRLSADYVLAAARGAHVT